MSRIRSAIPIVTYDIPSVTKNLEEEELNRSIEKKVTQIRLILATISSNEELEALSSLIQNSLEQFNELKKEIDQRRNNDDDIIGSRVLEQKVNESKSKYNNIADEYYALIKDVLKRTNTNPETKKKIEKIAEIQQPQKQIPSLEYNDPKEVEEFLAQQEIAADAKIGIRHFSTFSTVENNIRNQNIRKTSPMISLRKTESSESPRSLIFHAYHNFKKENEHPSLYTSNDKSESKSEQNKPQIKSSPKSRKRESADKLSKLEKDLKTFEEGIIKEESQYQSQDLSTKNNYFNTYRLKLNEHYYIVDYQTRMKYLAYKIRIYRTLQKSKVQNYNLQANHPRLYEILTMHMDTGIKGQFASIFRTHTFYMKRVLEENLIEVPTA